MIDYLAEKKNGMEISLRVRKAIRLLSVSAEIYNCRL